jgi:multiple sugar transport system permease protein
MIVTDTTTVFMFGASVVATIPVLILFALIERRIVSGLTAGSLK